MPVETRAKNKTTHPGLALRKPHQSREETRRLKEAREEAKAANQKARLHHIQEVSELEISEADHHKAAANTTPVHSYTDIAQANKTLQAMLKKTPKQKAAKLMAALLSEDDDLDVEEEPVRRRKPTQLRDAVEEMKAKSRRNSLQHVKHTAGKGTKRGHEKDPNLFLSPVAKRKKPAWTPAKVPRRKVKKVVVVETTSSEDEIDDDETEGEAYGAMDAPEHRAESTDSEPWLSDSAPGVDETYVQVYGEVGGQSDQYSPEVLNSLEDEQMDTVERYDSMGNQDVDSDDFDNMDYRLSDQNIDTDEDTYEYQETNYDNDNDVLMRGDVNELENVGAVAWAQPAHSPPLSSVNPGTPKAWNSRHHDEPVDLGAEPSFTPHITGQQKPLSSADTAKAQNGKGKAREQHPNLQFDYAGEYWDLAPQECAVFQDRDEREGEEHVHACFSPLKHGRRVDSQDLLTVNSGGGAPRPLQQHHLYRSKPLSQVEEDHSGEESGDRISSRSRKKRARPVTSNLPPELLHPTNKWKHEIMPALFLWVAARKDVWNIPVKELVDALTTICRTRVRRNYSLQRDGDTTGEESPEYRLATQRLSDWRSSLGFSAMWLVNNVVEECSELFPNDETRMTWAGFMVDEYRFLYSSIGSPDTMPTGLFQSQLYTKTFALHLSKFATDDSAWVPGLSCETDDHEPWGGMALAAAALERAFCLWRDGDLSVDLVKRASSTRSRAITFIPKVGPKGVQTTYHTNFSELRWAKSTKKFFKTIEARVKLTEEKKLDISRILSCARVYVKPNKKGRSKLATINTGGEDELDSDDSILGDTLKPIRILNSSLPSSSTPSVHPIPGLSMPASLAHGNPSSRVIPSQQPSFSHPGLSFGASTRGSSRVPSVPPFRAPSVPPSRAPSVPPSRAPSVPPSRAPSIPPSRVLSVPPSRTPSVPLSRASSRAPSIPLSRASSRAPSIPPSHASSRVPSVVSTRSSSLSSSQGSSHVSSAASTRGSSLGSHTSPAISAHALSGISSRGSSAVPSGSRSHLQPISHPRSRTSSGTLSLFKNKYSLYQLSTGLLEPPQPPKAARRDQQIPHGHQASTSASVLSNAPTSKGRDRSMASHKEKVSGLASQQVHHRKH